MNIVISADNRTDKQGRHSVRLSVCFMRKRFSTTMGQNMNAEQIEALRADFDHRPYSKKKAHPQHKDYIKMLRDIKDSLDWEEQKVVRGEQTADDIDFTSIFNKAKGKPNRGKRKPTEPQTTPFDVWLEFMDAERKRKDLAPSTIKELQYFINHVSAYNPTIPLTEFATLDGINQYIEWCIEQGMSNRTAKNQHAYAQWYLRWCYRKGYCGNDFERYTFDLKTPSKKESLVVFLTPDEIARVEALKLTGAIDLARDIFLFQCYTGLRHSDAVALQKSDIVDGTMRLTVKKTGTFLENRLNRYALRIVNKYIEQPGDALFPYLNMNSTELYLKQIGKLAGLDQTIRKVEYRNHERREATYRKYELITTHVGRKTFVVNSLDMGLTATQVIEYTGHSSIQAMEPYISISRKKKDEAMNVWDNIHGSNNEEELLRKRISELEARLALVQSQHQPTDADE